jgi:two-component system, NtrC family, sensor kinase
MRCELFDSAAQRKFSRRTEIEYGDVAPIYEKLVENEQSSVSFLYRVSQCLCTNRQLKPLLECLMEAVMDNVPAERGYVLARRDTSAPLKLMVNNVRQHRGPDPPVSHTLIDHVVQTKASVLTENASEDDRFSSSDSITEFQIKAVICVPMAAQDNVYGVIYLDANTVPVPLTQKHLQLLSIVGQVVGAGIENIVLNQRQIQQERLAGIGQAISGTSHDMRNIIMGISGVIELIELACENDNTSQVLEGTRILRKTLERFRSLSDSLLTYTRVAQLKLEDTNPDELISEVLGTVEAEAKNRSIDVRFASRAPGYVAMDSQQMYRVLLNLVRNAMDAMEGREGPINIETGNENGIVLIRVKDSGEGILPEHMEKIGQPFFSTKGDSGTGLGLAICYRIMEQHRGKIDVDSEPDRGTTFTLKFPPDHSMTRNDIVPPT